MATCPVDRSAITCVGKLTIHLCSIKSSLPFSLPLRHSRDKLYQALSHFSVLKATERWAGLGTRLGPHAVRRILWTSWDPSLVSPQTKAPMLSGGSLGHTPCCPEDSLDIPGSFLGVPSDTGPHAVRRILWTSWDPPLVSHQTQAPMLSGGSFGHPGILPWCPLRQRPPCCLEDPLDIPHAVRRIPWTSRDPSLVSHQTQAPMLSGGSFGHPGILPQCPLRHRPPLASFTGSPHAQTKNRKERGEPGKIYHVRNITGREDVITSGRTNELAHTLCILVPLQKLL